MAGVDLSIFQFDYDLTFAALLMNGDGTVYHRYGGRDETSATSRLSIASLVRVLRETLEDHAAYLKKPSPPPARPRRTIEDIPPMARKLQKKKIDCFHCHMVNDAEGELAREEGRWSREDIWRWPLPDQVGLELDRDDATLVRGVISGSPAAAAGIVPGDRLVRLGGERVRTQADVQWVLERAPGKGATLPVEHLRAGGAAPRKAELVLEKGWRAGTPLTFSWRPSMWPVKPQPGFGGKLLEGEDLEKVGLGPGTFAFRVGYIVDWGDDAHTGRSARKAGIRNGDIVLAAGGKKDFLTELHFQSWFRLTLKPGITVGLDVLREGRRMTIDLPVLP